MNEDRFDLGFDPQLTGIEVGTLVAMVTFANQHGDTAPNRRELAQLLNISDLNAAKRISHFYKNKKYLQLIRRGHYRIKDEVFCTKSDTAKFLLKFHELHHVAPTNEITEEHLIEEILRLNIFIDNQNEEGRRREDIRNTIDGCCVQHYIERNINRKRFLRDGFLLDFHLQYLTGLAKGYPA